MGPPRPLLTLDAGALLAVERRDRRVWAILWLARDDGWELLIPSGALAQVWRHPAQQASLATFLRWQIVRSEPLTDQVARRVGILCGRRGTSAVVDASVAICAHDHGGRVLSSDPDDLIQFIPSLNVTAVT